MNKILKTLIEYNYKEIEKDTWVLENWTIRLHGDALEAFNNPEKESGIYYTAPIKKVDIDTLLDEIDDNIDKSLEKL